MNGPDRPWEEDRKQGIVISHEEGTPIYITGVRRYLDNFPSQSHNPPASNPDSARMHALTKRCQ
jgi:hypothetical protein